MSSTWTQFILQTLANGASGGTVTFPVEFMTVPVAVDLWVVLPNSSAAPISVNVSAITTAGCAFTLSDTLAEAGYILQGSATAIQPQPLVDCHSCCPSGSLTRPTIQTGLVALGSGVDTIAINFPVAFNAEPSVSALVVKVDADHYNLFVTGYTITKTGFIATLQAPTDDATYKISYTAVLT